jgi:hypothetical protein
LIDIYIFEGVYHINFPLINNKFYHYIHLNIFNKLKKKINELVTMHKYLRQ